MRSWSSSGRISKASSVTASCAPVGESAFSPLRAFVVEGRSRADVIRAASGGCENSCRSSAVVRGLCWSASLADWLVGPREPSELCTSALLISAPHRSYRPQSCLCRQVLVEREAEPRKRGFAAQPLDAGSWNAPSPRARGTTASHVTTEPRPVQLSRSPSSPPPPFCSGDWRSRCGAGVEMRRHPAHSHGVGWWETARRERPIRHPRSVPSCGHKPLPTNGRPAYSSPNLFFCFNDISVK